MVVLIENIPQARPRPRSAGYARLLPSDEDSRRALLQLGVPRERIPTDPAADVVGLVCTLDRLFATGCGSAGVKWFMRTPDPELNGHAPAEVLDQPNGVERVRCLVRRQVELARTR